MHVLDAYARIAADHGLPEMHRGSCAAKTQTFADPDGLWSALQSLVLIQGWVQFQSRQLAFDQGLPEPAPDWGVLLAAEAVTGEGDSVLVAPDGAGGWRLTRYRHQAEGGLLCDEIAQLAHDPKTGRLRYRRYWRHDPEQGHVQAGACFIGFE